MGIRRATLADGEVLLEIWLRSVRATHAFVPEEDIQAMTPHVRDYLASGGPELWVLRDDAGACGFVVEGRSEDSAGVFVHFVAFVFFT